MASAAPCPLPQLLEKLTGAGLPATVVMIDGALHAPRGTLPEDWREVRLKTAAGMVNVTRKPGAIAVMVFGNADDSLKAAQAKVVEALESSK